MSQYKNQALQKADDGAKQIVSDFESVFEKFGELFKDMDKDLATDMQNASRRCFDMAKERLKQIISSQISLDNKSFADILSQSGEQKSAKLSDFIDETNANALRSFQNELENGLNSAFDFTRERLVGKLNAIKAASEQVVRFLQEQQKNYDKDGKEKGQNVLGLDIARLQSVSKALQG